MAGGARGELLKSKWWVEGVKITVVTEPDSANDGGAGLWERDGEA